MKTAILLICSAIAVGASPAAARTTKAKKAKPGVTAPSTEKAPDTGTAASSAAPASSASEKPAEAAPASGATTSAAEVKAPEAAPAPAPEPTVIAAPTATVASAQEDTGSATSVSTTVSPSQPVEQPAGMGLRVGAKVGAAIPTSKLGAAPVFGIDAEYRLPMLDRLLGIAAEFAYSAPSTSGSSTDPATGEYSYKLDTRITSIALEAIARRAFDRFEPYGGFGYSFVFLHDQTSAFAVKTTENQTRGGFQLRGGCGYLLGPGHVFAELRYQFAHFAFESTGSSSAGTFDVFAGYRFAL